MRRFAAVLLGGALIPASAGAAGVEASPGRNDKTRVVRTAYAPNPQRRVVVDAGTGTGSPGVSVASIEVFPTSKERAVTVTAVDESGTSVAVHVHQGRAWTGLFCGGSEDPASIRPGEPLTIEVFSGACRGGAGVATTGLVEVTFFRR